MAVLAFSAAVAPPPVGYECLDGSRFTLRVSDTEALVRFPDGEYLLPRRPSSLAIKYESKAATLFLDGEFAAFIANDRPLPGCYRLNPRKRD